MESLQDESNLMRTPTNPTPDKSIPNFAVLMTVFNGRRWLSEQMDSIVGQVGVLVTIFVSVDRSSDGSESWVDHLAVQDQRIRVLPRGQRFGGAAPNFFRLFRDVDFEYFDYVSLADQDDIWLPEKLLRAHERLQETGADAYSSNVTAFWENGKTALIQKSQKQVKWDFLFEAAGPGCTYVLTPSLAKSVQRLLREHQGESLKIGLHDWFIYAFARANQYDWLIDDYSGMLYRQHEHNQVGMNAGFRAFLHRCQKVLGGWAFSQAAFIAQLVGLGNDPFVRQWSGGSRRGLFGLAMAAGQCRRRLRDQFFFVVLCLELALTGVKVTPEGGVHD